MMIFRIESRFKIIRMITVANVDTYAYCESRNTITLQQRQEILGKLINKFQSLGDT